ncbi:redoxin domain-containing protein [Neiella marina]|uniref:Redoxin domain-containing protein n=1 Tax=Neiella holothuriorum TaxID=2870530 RepID=A0ABS7EGS7_9GAMM|nr:redoxin domain-containing protein [Neiella holothuriorum]MBW8191547.1 redoxin domain-containing protein [Neiella holothuriorum]
MKKFIRQLAPFAIIMAVFFAVQWYRSAPLIAKGEPVADYSQLKRLTTEGRTVPVDSLFTDSTRPKLVYLFAPWCGVCRVSLPAVNALANERSDIEIIAVALSYESTQQVYQFANELSLTLPVYLGDNQLMSDYRVAVFPTYYLLAPDLTVVSQGVGLSTKIGLSWRLDSLADEY